MDNNELKAIRETAELTQVELAEKLGVKQSQISYWESGERVIPAYIEKLIRSIFGGGK